MSTASVLALLVYATLKGMFCSDKLSIAAYLWADHHLLVSCTKLITGIELRVAGVQPRIAMMQFRIVGGVHR
jgi:hypothetical protein